MTEIKEQLKILRKKLGLRQQDMACKLGVPFTTISKYELGIIKPSSEILSKIAIVYNTNINWLLTGFGDVFIDNNILGATGTDGKPHLRLVKFNQNISVENIGKLPVEEIEDISSNKSFENDDSMISLAKKLKKPLTIEYFDNGKITHTKTFFPDGSVDITSSEPVEKLNIQNTLNDIEQLKQKIDILSKNPKKLEFVSIAIKSLEDDEALEKLKIFIKGIELTRGFKKS